MSEHRPTQQHVPGNSVGGEKHPGDAGGSYDTPQAASIAQPLQRWNESRESIFRVIAAIYSFVVLGMSDAAFGALLPYLETYYGIDYRVVALIFLAPFFGYIFAAIFNSTIHTSFGQLGIAVIAPLAKVITFVVFCNHPPYPVLPVIYVLCGFGNGLEDGGWNAWIGNMSNANELMGILHAAYGLGATLSPLIATSMVTKGGLRWYCFFYLMTGLAVIEWTLCVFAFRSVTGPVYRAANARNDGVAYYSGWSQTREALKDPTTWLAALSLFVSTGVEVGIGGWLVTFMLTIRHGNDFDSGMVVTGYWLGMTAGRVTLGFVTGRIGERLAVSCYLLLAIVLQLCFWLVPSFVASAIFVAWLGFFIGPLFPAAIIVATRILPQQLHVSAIGFAAASGSGGGAVLPFAIGAIVQAKGLWVLQPIILSLIVVVLAIWLLLSAHKRVNSTDESEQSGVSGSAQQF